MTDRGLKIREAFRKKYGVDHPSQLQSVKNKIKEKRNQGAYSNVSQKIKKTLKEKYGNENYVNVDKIKKTKLEKYGDENYNNREKMLSTNNDRYGMNVSPNTLKSIIKRIAINEVGFKSKKYLEYLNSKNIQNISQDENIKNIKRQKKLKHSAQNVFFGDRLNSVVTPLFSIDEYEGTDYYKKYLFKCNKCNHIFNDTLYSGNIPRCLQCYPYNRYTSKMENEICDFIRSMGIIPVQNDRTILDGNEIDILILDKQFGIEYNGIIWHSEVFGKKDKNYHLNKSKLAKLKNINLMHIFDWEWINKKDIIKSILKNKLGKNSKLYARKCNIEIISNKEKKQFINDNHIQGDDTSSIRLGLTYDGELVSVMTFMKSRFDKQYEYEMSRYCNKQGIIVVGGASKLFNYFIKNYLPSSIVSYCDCRYFTGKVYENIGFKYVNNSPPSYYYFDKNTCVPINRLHFQKHKLSKKLSNFDSKLTEWENMQLNGWDRIWDCGNLKYEWTKS